MENSKTVWKRFSIPQYRQEEDYLSEMNEKGWRFTHATFPGLYHFEKCEPGQVTYRLDYNQEGIRNKDEYVRMFSDCGWEYVCDFMGYSYFRKPGTAGEEREEIFCDDASRLDMMRRVFRGKIYPLIILFAAVILPQLLANTAGNSVGIYGRGIAGDILSFVFLGLAIVYLLIFSTTAVHFYRFEKEVSGDSMGTRLKYAGVFALIVALLAGIGVFFWASSFRSAYTLTENDTGYVMEIEKLNTSVVKEYDLKKGDLVRIHIVEFERGHLYLSITESGKEPVFFGDFYNFGYHPVEIQNDGHYLIEISGKRATGIVEVTIE
ncbi:MAG: DUF2812 domain-containing protein [Lachnospiraceae bacterium]|nr:DUF2812 domain-containing protein [Lachnospiraceae bacterium]